jgi:hypothetical protein
MYYFLLRFNNCTVLRLTTVKKNFLKLYLENFPVIFFVFLVFFLSSSRQDARKSLIHFLLAKHENKNCVTMGFYEALFRQRYLSQYSIIPTVQIRQISGENSKIICNMRTKIFLFFVSNTIFPNAKLGL